MAGGSNFLKSHIGAIGKSPLRWMLLMWIVLFGVVFYSLSLSSSSPTRVLGQRKDLRPGAFS